MPFGIRHPEMSPPPHQRKCFFFYPCKFFFSKKKAAQNCASFRGVWTNIGQMNWQRVTLSLMVARLDLKKSNDGSQKQDRQTESGDWDPIGIFPFFHCIGVMYKTSAHDCNFLVTHNSSCRWSPKRQTNVSANARQLIGKHAEQSQMWGKRTLKWERRWVRFLANQRLAFCALLQFILSSVECFFRCKNVCDHSLEQCFSNAMMKVALLADAVLLRLCYSLNASWVSTQKTPHTQFCTHCTKHHGKQELSNQCHFMWLFSQVLPRKPPKFSWVLPGLLAAHGRPTKPGHVQYLTNNGITTLVTLTENKPKVLISYPGTRFFCSTKMTYKYHCIRSAIDCKEADG